MAGGKRILLGVDTEQESFCQRPFVLSISDKESRIYFERILSVGSLQRALFLAERKDQTTLMRRIYDEGSV
jgi:hypothetical protein